MQRLRKFSLPAALLAATLVFLACSESRNDAANTAAKPVMHTGADVPDDLKPYQQKAQASFDALQKKIGGRLMEVIAAEGETAAISVCKTEAADLTSAVAKEKGFTIGRTSHRLRNPANQPPAWAKEKVEWGQDRKAAEAQVVVADLGDRVGVMAPIGIMPMCVSCHGEAGSLGSDVKAALSTQYSQDRATGFAVGDLRGWFWAEIKK
jgi:hypothetical protein